MAKDVVDEVRAALWESDSYWECVAAVQEHSPAKKLVACVYNHLPSSVYGYIEEWVYNNLTDPAEAVVDKIVHDAVTAYMDQRVGSEDADSKLLMFTDKEFEVLRETVSTVVEINEEAVNQGTDACDTDLDVLQAIEDYLEGIAQAEGDFG